jgi:hypothetical protein
MDVAIVDDAWVYKTYLTDSRNFKGSCASRDVAEVDAAKTFVREVRGMATPMK